MTQKYTYLPHLVKFLLVIIALKRRWEGLWKRYTILYHLTYTSATVRTDDCQKFSVSLFLHPESNSMERTDNATICDHPLTTGGPVFGHWFFFHKIISIGEWVFDKKRNCRDFRKNG